MYVDVEHAIAYLVVGELPVDFADTALFFGIKVATGFRPVSTCENQRELEVL